MRRNNKKSKIFFVTGAMGFIGTHWCKKLLKEGHFVYGLDIKKNTIKITLLGQSHSCEK